MCNGLKNDVDKLAKGDYLFVSIMQKQEKNKTL